MEVRGPIELDVQLSADDGSVPSAGTLVDRLTTHAGSSREQYEVVLAGWRFEVTVEPARHAQLRERAARTASDQVATGGMTLRAQIPGRVTRLWVGPGDRIEQGQRLLAVEAMKMENEVRAPRAGVVEEVSVSVGSTVERDDSLIRVGPGEGAA